MNLIIPSYYQPIPGVIYVYAVGVPQWVCGYCQKNPPPPLSIITRGVVNVCYEFLYHIVRHAFYSNECSHTCISKGN